jgi:hypothetical protein
MVNYHLKYLKYKKKYLEAKQMYGGEGCETEKEMIAMLKAQINELKSQIGTNVEKKESKGWEAFKNFFTKGVAPVAESFVKPIAQSTQQALQKSVQQSVEQITQAAVNRGVGEISKGTQQITGAISGNPTRYLLKNLY